MTNKQTSDINTQNNLGYTALSIMGWVELVMSVLLTFLEIYGAAVVFGLVALMMGTIANQVRKRPVDYRGHIPREVEPETGGTKRTSVFTILQVIGTGCLGLAVYYLIDGVGMLAFLTALYAATLAVLANRFRVPITENET